MIITKTPFRIPIVGGGTDLKFFYSKFSGNLISVCFNQYIYVYLSKRNLENKSLVQTSDTQLVNDNTKIRHNLIRETLKFFKIKDKLNIGFFSTLPTRSGIGSSSSLVVGLIKAIKIYKKLKLSKKKIAQIAIKIEREILKEEGGVQDQIIASYGGLKNIKINKKGEFKVRNINNKNYKKFIENNFILIYSNLRRYSNKIIKSQTKNKNKTIETYKSVFFKIKEFEYLMNKGNIKQIGQFFHDHWMKKKQISKSMTNYKLDKIYNDLMKNKNIFGGKLIGAGGGGFFLFVTNNKNKIKKDFLKTKYQFLDIKIS